jgi:hypothetical protein
MIGYHRPSARLVVRNVDLLIHASGIPAVQVPSMTHREALAVMRWGEKVRTDSPPLVVQTREINEQEWVAARREDLEDPQVRRGRARSVEELGVSLMGMDAYIHYLAEDARRGGDLLEQLEAGEECEHRRMPYDGTPECGCWGPVVTATRKHGQVERGRKLSDTQVLAAHRDHLDGVSINELGRRLWKRAGHRSAHACAEALRAAFHAKGLSVRPPVEAATLASTRTGVFARQDGRYREAYNQWRRDKHAELPQCHALRGDGTRCEYRVQPGHYLCGRHAKSAGQLSLLDDAQAA